MFALLLLAALLGLSSPADGTAYFTSDPTISPDGTMIVFTYEGDLWQVASTGGVASRLTAMEGEETHARFSPDGQWIAFSGRQQGNADVYLLPVGGGDVRQLTAHSSDDRVDGWSWDGQTIYFSSSRHNRVSIYTISATGGTPHRLVGHYFNTIHHAAEHPQTGHVYFTDTWESDSFAHRKRYRGAYNPDLKSVDPETGATAVYTTFEGKDFWPTIDRSGTVYFASDRANGQYNLYRLTDDAPEALTAFGTSIKRPHASADGRAVVFERDYQLWRYDAATGHAAPVPVQIYANNTLALSQDFDVKSNITDFDVAPDKKKLAFVSRGQVFVSDIKGQFVRQLPTGDAERVVQVKWLADSKTLLLSQTHDGYLNLFSMPADGSASPTQHTDDAQNNQALVLSPDRSQGAYLSGRNELRRIDLEMFESETLVRDEFWALYPTPPAFSPDGAYLAFTSYQNFEQDILVHHFASGTTTNLTRSGVTETSPAWSPDGRYLYFSSDRTQESYPRGDVQPDIYRMRLARFAPPFKSDRFDALFAEEDEAKDSTGVTVVIDPEGLELRWEQMTRFIGRQGSPLVLGDEDTQTMLFTTNHDEGKTALWKTVMKPFEAPKTERLTDGFVASIVEVDGSVYALKGGTIQTVNVDGGKLDAIDITHTFRKNLAAEFAQMYHETWANVEENYYDETFQGHDWHALRRQYAAFLPHLQSRANLRTLLNDLLGELNSSHMGFSTFGQEEAVTYRQTSMTAGLLFDADDPYRVGEVLPRGRLARDGADVQTGDVLVAVAGDRVDAAANREGYFVRPSADEELALTFRRGASEHTVRLRPESAGALRTHLYDGWIDDNQRRVDEDGAGQIAYVHMKNMGGGSLEQFLIEMTTEAHHRDALILDLRYNTGGNVHDDVLQFLQQRSYLQWKYRGGEMTPQPAFRPSDKPMVLLINEQTLSDAEMTTTGFKELGLGTVIGTETYRWIIFTSGKGLVDGSFYRLPSWGCYTLDGQDIERTGVTPDVFVETTFEDRLHGRDPQLDRAIEELQRALQAGASSGGGE